MELKEDFATSQIFLTKPLGTPVVASRAVFLKKAIFLAVP
jgi:hypothetical protein